MSDTETRIMANLVRQATNGIDGARVDNMHHDHAKSWFIVEHPTGHYTVTVERRGGAKS